MRIAFMGTAELASPCLEAVAKLSGQQVVAIVTQPDRPKGRDLKPTPPPVKVAAEHLGLPVQQPLKIREPATIDSFRATQPDRPKGRDLKPTPPPVKIAAEHLGLPVQQPLKIREPATIDSLRAVQPDLIIVVAYGQILPKSVLEIPHLGCVNVHTSLLPRWRGAAPIQYAILHGDRETGVTTMYMDEHMDTGDIILQRAQLIHAYDTSATLHDRLAKLGADLLVETVRLVAEGKAPRAKQDETRATYAKKITKD